MAVILREQVALGGKKSEIKVFHPSGTLSKEYRERAEKLDIVLQEEMPIMAARVLRQVAVGKNSSPIYKWHLFGMELRKIADNDLVLPLDVKSGMIWEAVWQHLPESLKPSGTKTEKRLLSKKRTKGRDHFSICYALGAYAENDIRWIRRWDDWCQIYYRDGILQDKRVFDALGEEVRGLKEYPSAGAFRKIVANIAHRFPQRTGKKVHTAVLAKAAIRRHVHDSAMQVGK